MRRLSRSLLLLVLPLITLGLSTPAAAAGADVVAGHGSAQTEEGGRADFDFTSGASDTTPGTGLDGHGVVKFQLYLRAPLGLHASFTGRVVCVNVAGDTGIVAFRTTKNDPGARFQTTGGSMIVQDGAAAGAPDVVGWYLETQPITDAQLVARCNASGAPVLPTTSGNITVKDGA